MIGKVVSHYEILEPLGAGGMGVVYKARDSKLERLVALKFLPPQFSHDQSFKQRFVNEARAASALDHPNICTIYEIDETDDGQLFIAMALYEGESLKERLERGPMRLESAVDLTIQIADAIGLAHDQGILHRDVKPANVFVTSRGQAKVLDFGLAKFVGGEKLTQTGTSMGTLNYMPPEQLRGEIVDLRADIWALGAVAYEMLTGQAAFGGDNEGAVVYNILNRDPAPLEPTGSSIDVGLERLLGRSLAKSASDRYETMSALQEDLSALQGRIRRADSEVTAIQASDDQPTLVLDHSLGENQFGDSAGFPDVQTPGIAILDFANSSSDPAAAWLSSGIADSLSADLGKVKSLRVIDRRKVRDVAGDFSPERVLDLGQRLNARWLFWGAFQKLGEAIRVDAHCVGMSEGGAVLTLQLDGSMSEIFKLQDQVVSKLVQALDLEVSDSEMHLIEQPQTLDLEAYEYCAKARQMVYEMGPKGIEQAQEYLDRAIDIDPGYAMAYSTLGQLYSMRFIARTDPEDLTKAIETLQKATSLDPDLSDAHAWLTYVFSRENRFDEAIASGRRAVELDPDNAQAHYFLGVAFWLRWTIGHVTDGFAEAAAHFEKVIELVPGYQPGHQILGNLLFKLGRYDEAWDQTSDAAEIEETGDWQLGKFVGAISSLARQAYRAGKMDLAEELVDKAFKVSGEAEHVYMPACNALTYCTQGDLLLRTQRADQALVAYRRAKQQASASPRSLGIGWSVLRAAVGMARAFQAIGMKTDSESSLKEARALFWTKSDYDFGGIWDGGEAEIYVELAVFYASANRQDEALEALEKAIDCGWMESPRLELEQSFGNLRAKPRFQAIQDKIRDRVPKP